MNRFFVFRFKKLKTVLFAGLLLGLIVITMLCLKSDKDVPNLYGSWFSQDKVPIQMQITPSEIRLNDFVFSYELTSPVLDSPDRQNPQGFVMDGREMGAVSGRFFFEDGLLYLEIDSQTKIFEQKSK